MKKNKKRCPKICRTKEKDRIADDEEGSREKYKCFSRGLNFSFEKNLGMIKMTDYEVELLRHMAS